MELLHDARRPLHAQQVNPVGISQPEMGIDGISAKVLSAELKDLELNGFIRRNVFTGTPVVVEYELTNYADTLGDVLHSLSEWGAMHKEEVRKSMKRKKPVAV